MIKEGIREIEIEFDNKKYIKEIEIKKFEFRKTTVKLDKKKKQRFLSVKSQQKQKNKLSYYGI